MKKQTDRDHSIDAVAGILILFMILRHTLERTGMAECGLYEFTQFFFIIIPWFFFKGGMFFKPRDIKDCITKGATHLLVPFLKYSLIGHLCYCVIMWMNGDRDWVHYILTPLKELVIGGAVTGNIPLWFLFSFFVVRLLGQLCFKNTKMVFLTFIVCYTLSNVFFYTGFKHPYWLVNICTGLAYFSLGNMMRQVQYHKAVAVVALCVYVYFGISGLTIVDIRANHLIRGVYAIHPIWAVSGIVLINNIFKYIRIKPIEHIGKDSMDYYVYHWVLITIVFIALKSIQIPTTGSHSLLIVSVCLCCILPFMNHLLQIMNQYWDKAIKTIQR